MQDGGKTNQAAPNQQQLGKHAQDSTAQINSTAEEPPMVAGEQMHLLNLLANHGQADLKQQQFQNSNQQLS